MPLNTKEKTLKVKQNEELMVEMMQKLTGLQNTIESMGEKRGKIFIDWIETCNKYLQWEETFDPKYLRSYKRSEIVFAHFGFNVGSEFGGLHYAVVVKDSSKSDPLVNVVPLSSLEKGIVEEDIHREKVFLGEIPEIHNNLAVAIPNQMRPMSKIRIFKPRNSSDRVYKLNSDQMDKLDNKIRRMYTKLRNAE